MTETDKTTTPPRTPAEVPAIVRIAGITLFFIAAAALGRAFTDTASGWYQALVKPVLQPPPIVFGIVWPVLYLLMIVSAALALTDPKHTGKTLMLYAATGVLNVLWSYTFFTLHNPAGALFVLLLIIACAVLMFKHVYNINTAAAYLLIPYILWLFFALYLNYEIAFLN